MRADHSTITATAAVVNDTINLLDKQPHSAALFVDLSKTFDTVDNNNVLYKPLTVGFDVSAYTWFKSYHPGRVVADGFKSNLQMVDKCVPQ